MSTAQQIELERQREKGISRAKMRIVAVGFKLTLFRSEPELSFEMLWLWKNRVSWSGSEREVVDEYKEARTEQIVLM